MKFRVKVAASLVLAAGLALALAAPAQAAFNSAATGTASVATATLAPPTALQNTSGLCFIFHRPSISWTHSTSNYRDGYEVRVSRNGTLIATVDQSSTSTSWTAPTTLLNGAQSWSIVVASTYKNWSTASSALTFTC